MSNRPSDNDKGRPRRPSDGQGQYYHPSEDERPPSQQYYHPSQGQGPPPAPYMHGPVHPSHSFDNGQMMPPRQHTTVIVNQPPSVLNQRILGPKEGHREWSTGLFSCCDDVGKCLWAMWCPSCVLSDISTRLGECSCITCCVPGGLAAIRTRIRTLGGIRGSICNDYLATECCYSCAMCQIQRELDYMGL